MNCDDDANLNVNDADFQRWYFGGTPPEGDGWSRHAFEDALIGALNRPDARDAYAADAPFSHERARVRSGQSVAPT